MNYDGMMKAEGNKEMKRQEAQAAEAGRNEVAGSLAAQRADCTLLQAVHNNYLNNIFFQIYI